MGGGGGGLEGFFHTILSQVGFGLARKPYWIGLLFTHRDGEFGVISVTE